MAISCTFAMYQDAMTASSLWSANPALGQKCVSALFQLFEDGAGLGMGVYFQNEKPLPIVWREYKARAGGEPSGGLHR